MKKICFVTTVSYTLNTFVKDTAYYLHEKGGYDITFICDYNKEFEESLPDFITYIPVSMKRGINLSGVNSLKKLYQIFKSENYDMVQYSTPNASLYTSIAAKMAGIPHRLYCQWGMYYTGLSGLKRLVFKSIEKQICNNSTFIEPDSYGNLHYSWSEGLYSAEKSGVIWNGSATGVDINKYNIENKQKWREEIRQLHGIELKDKVVGFVGRITKDKGINELLKSIFSIFDKISDVYLILVGEVENEEKLDKELWEKAQKDSRIIFCGSTKDTEKYYATMDFLVLPSYREGFGMVVIEAETMQLPVIVTNIPGPTEAMIPDKTGLVVRKKDSDDLTKAILYLLKNENERNLMGKEARTFVVENFERETFMNELLKSREKMLSEEKISSPY